MTYSDADCENFYVQRSITGITIPFPNALEEGDTFKFAATSTQVQIVEIGADLTAAGVAESFNEQGLGIKATVSSDGDVIIRTTARKDARFRLYASDGADHCDLDPETSLPGLGFEIVGSVARVDETYVYDFEDADGDPLDVYRVTSDSSLPTLKVSPVNVLESLCVLEGRLTTMSNSAVKGAKVTVEVRLPSSQGYSMGLSDNRIETKTDDYGRFSLPLVRNQLYLIQIPAMGYNEVVMLPNKDVVNLLELVPNLGGQFSPTGDPELA